MTREEAIENIKRLIGFSDTLDESIFTLFPELKESENERIRKELVSIVKAYRENCIDEGNHRFDDCLSYLEKQKEQKPITESKRLANEVIEYLIRCGYSPVLKDDSKKEYFRIDIPRHEDDFWDSEEYKHCRSVLGEYYLEGYYGCDTYTLYVWRAKKEKKPTEWSNEDEYMLYETIQHLEQLILIDKAKHCGVDVQYYQRDIDWLKSLRPQPHWKPSEEQMYWLEKAISQKDTEIGNEMEDELRKLYRDLKKL